MISIIACITQERRALGANGNLLFNISDDLRRFKALTSGHTVVMGRKTFDSLPKGALPNRRNIVITRNRAFEAPNVEVAHSLEQAIAMTTPDEEVFIIGGAAIYAAAMPIAQCLQLTVVYGPEPTEADTYFPLVTATDWLLTQSSPLATDPRSSRTFRFLTYTRR